MLGVFLGVGTTVNWGVRVVQRMKRGEVRGGQRPHQTLGNCWHGHCSHWALVQEVAARRKLTGDPGYPERDTGERVSPEKKALGCWATRLGGALWP